MQADYDFRSCRTCGLLFAGGLPNDEKLHRFHHTAVLQGVKAQVCGVPSRAVQRCVSHPGVPHLTLMQRHCRAYPSQCPWSGSGDPAAGWSAGTDWWWFLMTLETRTKRFVLLCCWSLLLLLNLLQCQIIAIGIVPNIRTAHPCKRCMCDARPRLLRNAAVRLLSRWSRSALW